MKKRRKNAYEFTRSIFVESASRGNCYTAAGAELCTATRMQRELEYKEDVVGSAYFSNM
jgi:hypothetical protein